MPQRSKDKVIIIAYCWVDEKKAVTMRPKVVMVDENNKVINTVGSESHGKTLIGQ